MEHSSGPLLHLIKFGIPSIHPSVCASEHFEIFLLAIPCGHHNSMTHGRNDMKLLWNTPLDLFCV